MDQAFNGLGLLLALLIGPNPPAVARPDPVQEVLQRYEQVMCPLTSFSADFQHRSYDFTFEVEIVSHGRIYFESFERAKWESWPSKVEEGKKGFRFPMKSTSYEKWLWKDGFVIRGSNNGSEKAAARDGWFVPTADRFFPPILTGASPGELKRDFRIQFVKTSGSDTVLSFYPLHQKELANYRRLEVLFDEGGIPLAYKQYDTTGTREDLFMLDRKSIRINRPLEPGDDPLETQPNEFERLLRERLDARHILFGS